MSARIDINADLGESFGAYRMGHDEALFPHLTSCNIACGFHGGDPVHILTAVRQAKHFGLRVGAHPSYPDRAGFGRRILPMPMEALRAAVAYQVGALSGLCRSEQVRLSYVKPHGALYNQMADDAPLANQLIEAIQAVDDQLVIMGLAGSAVQEVCQRQGIPFIAEAFADRMYTAEGRLVSRQQANAVIEHPAQAAAQVCEIVLRQRVLTEAGTYLPVHAQSICIHGDNPAAPALLTEIDRQLQLHGIQKVAYVA